MFFLMLCTSRRHQRSYTCCNALCLQTCSHLLWGRPAQRDSAGGRETSAAESDQSAVGADRGWSEGRRESGEGGAMSGHGCVGGGGRCRFPHQESAGRSRRCGPVDPSHRAYSSNLLGEKNIKTHETLKNGAKMMEKTPFFHYNSSTK